MLTITQRRPMTSIVCIFPLHCTFSASSAICSAALWHVKAHAKINRTVENSTPRKIVTPEKFTLKICTRDYVGEKTLHANVYFLFSVNLFVTKSGELYCTVFSHQNAKVDCVCMSEVWVYFALGCMYGLQLGGLYTG